MTDTYSSFLWKQYISMQKCQYHKSKTTMILHSQTNINQHCFSSSHRHNWPVICSMFYFGWKSGPQNTVTTSSCVLSGSSFRSYPICPADVIQQMISSGTEFKCGLTASVLNIWFFCYCCNMILMYTGWKDLNKAHTNSTNVKETSSFSKV